MLTEHGLPIAPSTYYDRRHSLEQGPSRQQVRDAQLEAHVRRVPAAHFGVYGAREV